MNFHAKFRASSSKIERVILNLVLGGHFVFCRHFLMGWLREVKIYLHAKFRASSSKIERVMLNFVFGAVRVPVPVPVTNLPVELCASRQLIIII